MCPRNDSSAKNRADLAAISWEFYQGRIRLDRQASCKLIVTHVSEILWFWCRILIQLPFWTKLLMTFNHGSRTIRLNSLSPCQNMMTSSDGDIFRVTGPMYGEFTGHRWIPHRKASDAELNLILSLVCASMNGWANNCETGDLRRHSDHYDVIVTIYAVIKRDFLNIFWWAKFIDCWL